jgi:hypothetical protein
MSVFLDRLLLFVFSLLTIRVARHSPSSHIGDNESFLISFFKRERCTTLCILADINRSMHIVQCHNESLINK